jgi:uncharacterized protein (DUF1778 family)
MVLANPTYKQSKHDVRETAGKTFETSGNEERNNFVLGVVLERAQLVILEFHFTFLQQGIANDGALLLYG